MSIPELTTLLAGARELDTPITDTQAQQLLAYMSLLSRWNRTYNLTAIREPSQMVHHHLLDSLALVQPLTTHTHGRPVRLLDVGSGGGLPGVVLAIVQPEISVLCVDAVQKKATFIRQVAAELGLPNLAARHARVEALAEPPFDVITARAFASLSDLVRLTRPLLAPAGVWIAMKGQHPRDELQDVAPHADVFHVEQLQVPGLHAERCLVWMRPHAC